MAVLRIKKEGEQEYLDSPSMGGGQAKTQLAQVLGEIVEHNGGPAVLDPERVLDLGWVQIAPHVILDAEIISDAKAQATA